MNKWKAYGLGIGICLSLVGIIGLFGARDCIYRWMLGDVELKYGHAMAAYRGRAYEQARSLFVPLARMDSASYAQYLLGDMYYRGLGGNRDYDRAFSLFRKSADRGNLNARNNIAFMYMYGHGVEADYAKAREHFKWAASQGNAQAQLGLGTMYRHGWGIQRSYREALEWYYRSAAHGNADAMNNIGYMYYNGMGTSTNAGTAHYWFRKSASLGNAAAQYNMGVLYCCGKGGVSRNLEEASSWLLKAASQGNVPAQYNLGRMFYWGKGMKKDVRKAEMWYRMAAYQGHKRAEIALKKLEKGMVMKEDSVFMLEVADR